jgi:opacity protein-like surface antigen
MKKILCAAVAAALTLGSAQANAFRPPPPIPQVDAKSNTGGYLGLNWTLGGSLVPAVVLGVFKTQVQVDGDTEGAHLSMSVSVANGIKPQTLKLGYLKGKDDAQGEIGAGYNFVKGEPLLSVGANVPHLNIGADLYRNLDVTPYLNLITKDRFDRPDQSAPVPDPV